jgi:hypothetical protein
MIDLLTGGSGTNRAQAYSACFIDGGTDIALSVSRLAGDVGPREVGPVAIAQVLA